jgi:hypothetical protein
VGSLFNKKIVGAQAGEDASEGRKVFFFEKKKQKTFVLGLRRIV